MIWNSIATLLNIFIDILLNKKILKRVCLYIQSYLRIVFSKMLTDAATWFKQKVFKRIISLRLELIFNLLWAYKNNYASKILYFESRIFSVITKILFMITEPEDNTTNLGLFVRISLYALLSMC